MYLCVRILLLLLDVLFLPAAVDEHLLHDVAPQLLVEGEHHEHEAGTLGGK